MNAMTFAGQRGGIVWGKRGRQYDTFLVKLGLFVPFVLGEQLHVWDLPTTTDGTCKAIKLRPDKDLKKRVLRSDWAAMGGIGLLIACPFLWTHAIVGATSLVLAVALITTGLVMMRDAPRLKDIRLVLGPHTWGSSDPATWAKSIRRDVVDTQAAFGIKSYAALAKKAMESEEWCIAMWAARLCVAVENADQGEELTDLILAEDDVKERLAQVRSSPMEHRREFGKAPPLEQWLTCDPEIHILVIG